MCKAFVLGALKGSGGAGAFESRPLAGMDVPISDICPDFSEHGRTLGDLPAVARVAIAYLCDDSAVTLYIGAENWPFPISIVKTSSGAWYFDTESGKQEVLYRRIGINENDAIEISV